MDAQALIIPLLTTFSHCFTAPGYAHFQHFVLAHMALLGVPHCVTEVMRLRRWHQVVHWTTPYVFMKTARWSCQAVSQCLLELICLELGYPREVIVAIDDSLVKKWGRKFFGLGRYPDPTDKNPGASKRRVWGHCWVVMALLWEQGPNRWFSFPLSGRLFVPTSACPKGWVFQTKIELAERLLKSFRWPAERVIVVVDNLYAKAKLATNLGLQGALGPVNSYVLISRLRSNAALYERPGPRRPGQRGATPKRGKKVSAKNLYRRRSKRRQLQVNIYGKKVTIDAFVDVLIPSRTLGSEPILVVIFPRRCGKKMNIFFSTEITLEPERLLELYAARFKIEDSFDELKTVGGLADCRQRGFNALRRHVTLSLVAYSLLRLLSVTRTELHGVEVEPWWHPSGPPSVTRLRRAVLKSLHFSPTLYSEPKPGHNSALKKAA